SEFNLNKKFNLMYKLIITACVSVFLFCFGCDELERQGFTQPKEHETHSEHQEKGHHDAGKLVTTTPLIMDTIISKEYVCQIHSKKHIELRALEQGYIENIHVDEGQLVNKGQLMF